MALSEASRAKLNELRASPKAFLEANEIFINGHKKKDTGHVRGPAWFLMSYEPARKRFVFEPMGGEHDRAGQAGYRFQAISVPAVSHDDVSEHRNFQELVPTELKDLDVMLTTLSPLPRLKVSQHFLRVLPKQRKLQWQREIVTRNTCLLLPSVRRRRRPRVRAQPTRRRPARRTSS